MLEAVGTSGTEAGFLRAQSESPFSVLLCCNFIIDMVQINKGIAFLVEPLFGKQISTSVMDPGLMKQENKRGLLPFHSACAFQSLFKIDE